MSNDAPQTSHIGIARTLGGETARAPAGGPYPNRPFGRLEVMIEAFGVGAAVLAFWTVARYPSFGPQSVGAAALFTVGMFVLQTPLLALVTPVVRTAGTRT